MEELEACLHGICEARWRRDRDTYCFRWGLMLGTMTRVGYRLHPEPVPIDPSDRWRVCLNAELAFGRAVFEDSALMALDAQGHTLLHHLTPPD